MDYSDNLSLYEQLKKRFFSVIKYDYDLPIIMKFLRQYAPKEKAQCRILDVGCGYGGKLKPILEEGYDALGIDINPTLVAANKANGMPCLTLEEFEENSEQFDIILMSHIIEHFQHSELKEFMDSYLDRLKKNGLLIIATPLLSPTFYHDFDHVKPYSPHGIMTVFGDKYDDQVKYTSHNKLRLKDLKFRKRHYTPYSWRGWYMIVPEKKLIWAMQFIGILLCRGSLGLIGRTDGWIGVFEKVRLTTNK